ncbi:multidrug efflux ATP-binding/permease protein Rv0194 [Streptosporangium roseum]|uniref:ABC-type multidrug transport system ATPase and permease components-like protein n=2 Tax=Streptosporangium roseum TaxID=2001 RepID=D2BF46_STRRD|nr:ABC-type multidrug transport system ATPase and permease components-like protein [Streptosporangium roseum DSM 43021]
MTTADQQVPDPGEGGPADATGGGEADARRTPEEGRELLPVAAPARTRAAVRELLRPHRGLALGGFAVMVAATAVGLLTQPLLGRIVDLVADRHPAGALTLPAALLVLVALTQGGATALGLSLISRLGETALAELRERFIERALRLPLEQVEKAGSGDLTARVTGDVSQVSEAIRTALPELARSLLAIVLTLGALAVLDWRFLLAALLAVPVQAHTARWYVRNAVPLYARQRVAAGAQQQQLLDTIGGAATVRAFRLEAGHTERVTRRSLSAVELTMRGVRLVLRFYSRLHLAEYTGLAAVLVVGFLLVRDGSASIGTATAAALYFHSLFGPVNSALVLLDDAQSAGASLSRLVGVADQAEPERQEQGRPEQRRPEQRRPEQRRPEQGRPEQGRPEQGREQQREPGAPPEGAVTVSGLGHAYEPGRPVLHDVDLTLRPGERVALVGASGAGKTTLAKIIAGIHHPTTGSVRLAVSERHGAGRAVALVTQEVHVFAGPLADDLRLARPDAGDDDLREALARVDALAWAEALPDGLRTIVGEGGHRLTAAQTQQLALARLVLADLPIAVLDEATAEAGSAGARMLEKATERAVEGRTALVVAHRLAQAATADRIVVMDGGRVVESGGHDELRAAGGRYAALWGAWSEIRDTAHHQSPHPTNPPSDGKMKDP